jgi:DMSO/TMAO reductase YedYZ molybdopterin-dependent catalytic subunit
MKRPRSNRLAVALALGVLATAPGLTSFGQSPEPAKDAKASVAIKVHGEVAKPLDLTAADLAGLKRQTVTARAHDNRESKYEGVLLHDVLHKAALPAGKDLRGKAVSLYLIVEAADGYKALFALAELDPAYNDRTILLADHRDGQPLTAREGPYQIVVPGEKRHSRWVRQVVGLRIGKD